MEDNKVLSCDPFPKLPKKEYMMLLTRLQECCGEIFTRPDPLLDIVDEAFPFNAAFVDPEEAPAYNSFF